MVKKKASKKKTNWKLLRSLLTHAAYFQASAWDEIREIEKLVGKDFDFATTALQDFAASVPALEPDLMPTIGKIDLPILFSKADVQEFIHAAHRILENKGK